MTSVAPREASAHAREVSTTPTTQPGRPSAYGLAPGERVGRYAIVGRLGGGGMGLVYTAHDPQLDRRVALKVVRRELDSDEARGRLAREAQAMAKLSHPNVVGVFDAGVFEDADGASRVFIAMELVEGQDLREWGKALRETERWKRGEAWPEIVDRYLAAGEGLRVAHEAGLVHRDFKPANVLVDREGGVRVGDFGLARPIEQQRVAAAQVQLEAADVPLDLTRTQDMIGTPGYMAPELYWPKPASAESDQYAFCVSLYEALYGERPVPGDTFGAIVLATVQGRLREPPARPPVPAELRRIVLRGLAVEPGERWPDMGALLDALRAERERPQRRRRALGVAGLALAVVGVAYGAGAITSEPAVNDPCGSASRAAEAIFDDARRDATHAALASVDVPFAARSAEAAVTGLDPYAADLGAAYRRACEATHVAHTQSEATLDRRTACLDRRALALDALVRELETADAAVVERASLAVQSLPSIAACDDAGSRDDATTPPELAEAVDGVTRRLASARAKLRAGRLAEAEEEASRARTEAEGIEWPPLRREAELAHGQAQLAAGQFEEADRALHAAALEAIRAEDDEALVEAATGLVDVAGVRRSRPDEGRVWADLASATLTRLGPRPMASAALESERARLMSALGERERAVDHALEALRIVEEARGPDSLAVAPALAQLVDALAMMRAFRRAVEPVERLDRLLAAHFDERHPERIAAAVRVAGVYVHLRRREEATERIDRARELAVAHLPTDHPVRARALMRRGDVLALTGHADEAIAEYELALEATRAVYGDEHTEVARGLLNLAGAYARSSQTDRALALWREALALRERLLGDDHPDLAILLQNIGSVQVERGRASEVLEVLARARRIQRRHAVSRQARADVDFWYGRALYETGTDREQGRAMVVAAQQVSEEGGYDRPDMRDWLAANP